MALLMLSTMTEAMKGTVATPEVGDEAEAVASVAVEGVVATMVLRGMLSMTLEATIKKHHEVQLLL